MHILLFQVFHGSLMQVYSVLQVRGDLLKSSRLGPTAKEYTCDQGYIVKPRTLKFVTLMFVVVSSIHSHANAEHNSRPPFHSPKPTAQPYPTSPKDTIFRYLSLG